MSYWFGSSKTIQKTLIKQNLSKIEAYSSSLVSAVTYFFHYFFFIIVLLKQDERKSRFLKEEHWIGPTQKKKTYKLSQNYVRP